ncbi:MAG TPA: hypothetical protein VFK80_10100, partial [Limnochordia bacterium]|nr:hypothetical protein [Limnochordia bacterium]
MAAESADGRHQRAKALLAEVEAYLRNAAPPQGGQARMGDYAALMAIHGNDAELNRAFASLAPEGKAGAPPSQYSLNLLMSMLNLYFKYRARLDGPAVCHFWRVLLQACAPQSRIHRYDFGFANTNHPLKCAAIQVLSGEILGDEDIVASGLEKLRGLSRKLAVSVGTPYSAGGYLGAVSEFNSPTYSALQLMPAALLANHSGLPEVRALGTLLQELIFMDVLSHWHPPTQESAGPTSRGYMDNTLGGTGLLKYVLHVVLPGGV